MSTVTVQTISNGVVSTSSENVIRGSARAWVNFNGTGTVAIRSSYNVSSITDNGTGLYRINFTNALPNNLYAVTTGATNQTGNTDSANNIDNLSTTSFTWQHLEANANTDSPLLMAAVFSS
jgi:hypothetical protein